MFEIRTKRKKILIQVILLIMTIPYLIPLVQMVMGSLGGIGLGNYKAVWDTGVIPIYFRNSLIIAASVIALVYIFSMTAGFGFAKLRMRGKEFFFWMILIALTLPEVILLTPLFVTFQTLGMYDKLIAVILPIAALQIPFTILLTRNFDEGIPSALMESARIDGANICQVFFHIILPLARPIAASIIVLTLINAWNSYLLPLVFLSDPSNLVVTLIPQYFQGEYANDQTKILAAAVMVALPEIVAYLLLQKQFEKGMSAGALK